MVQGWLQCHLYAICSESDRQFMKYLPEVVVPHRVFEEIPAAECPPPHAPLGNLLFGHPAEYAVQPAAAAAASAKHLPELCGVADPRVGRLGGHEEGVVLVVQVEELDVSLGALGHADGALVDASAQILPLVLEALPKHRCVPE